MFFFSSWTLSAVTKIKGKENFFFIAPLFGSIIKEIKIALFTWLLISTWNIYIVWLLFFGFQREQHKQKERREIWERNWRTWSLNVSFYCSLIKKMFPLIFNGAYDVICIFLFSWIWVYGCWKLEWKYMHE